MGNQQRIARDLYRVRKSPQFLDGEPGALEAAKRLEKELGDLAFQEATPRRRFQALVKEALERGQTK